MRRPDPEKEGKTNDRGREIEIAQAADNPDRQWRGTRDRDWEQPESKVSVYDSIGDWEGEAFWNGHEWWVEGESFNDINDVKYWAEFEAQKARDRGNDFEARFDSYTEDGGDNYREILLRVPNLHETGKNRSANFGRFTISHPPKKLGIHLRV